MAKLISKGMNAKTHSKKFTLHPVATFMKSFDEEFYLSRLHPDASTDEQIEAIIDRSGPKSSSLGNENLVNSKG